MRRIYFDDNVFLAFVSEVAGRAGVVEELLRQVQPNAIAVLTSTVSIAEVAYGAEEKTQRALEAGAEERIETLWAPGGPVTLVEASRHVMTTARALIRANLAEGHGRLTPLDAIHLATAKIEHVNEFATYETNKHTRWSELIELKVHEPAIAQPPLDFGEPSKPSH